MFEVSRVWSSPLVFYLLERATQDNNDTWYRQLFLYFMCENSICVCAQTGMTLSQKLLKLCCMFFTCQKETRIMMSFYFVGNVLFLSIRWGGNRAVDDTVKAGSCLQRLTFTIFRGRAAICTYAVVVRLCYYKRGPAVVVCVCSLYLQSPPLWQTQCCWEPGFLRLWPSLSNKSSHWEPFRSPEVSSHW